MHSISALVAGIRGAENGTANIYQRGTVTPVTYYTDFEAANPVPGGLLNLDANGGGIAYVNELVTVLVKNSVGATVRTFVAGDNAKSVEVLSSSFLGAAYVGGAIAAGNPTTAAAIFDKWIASAGVGATDWKVLYNGSVITLQSLAAKIGTPVFNVKAPEYGAVGDGVADDTSAINAAKTAAVAAGGGVVFFPPGTYRTTAALSIQSNISLLGSGPGVSLLKLDHASASHLNFQLGAQRRSITGLTISASQANSGTLLSITSSKLSFYLCELGSANNAGNFCQEAGGSTGSQLYFEECTMVRATGSVRFMSMDDLAATYLVMARCTLTAPANAGAASNMVTLINGVIDNCKFDISGCTAGTIQSVISARGAGSSNTASGQVSITNCEFVNSGGATVSQVLDFGSPTLATADFHESGNRFGSNIPYRSSGAGLLGKITLGSRIGKFVEVASDAANLDIGAQSLAAEYVHITRSTNTDQVISIGLLFKGLTTFVGVRNNSGGTIANETVFGGAPVSMATTTKRLWMCRVEIVSGPLVMPSAMINGAVAF